MHLQYDVLAHWMWSRYGWLRTMGAIDFAGGAVVHMSSGFSAMVCGWFLGNPAEPAPEESELCVSLMTYIMSCVMCGCVR